MLSLKCGYPFLCEFPILFLTVKLKLGHNFSQFIHRFINLDFEILVLRCVYFQVFPNS